VSPPARGERLPAQQHIPRSSTDPRVPTRQDRSQRGNELVAQNELVLTEPHRHDDEPSQLRQSAHEPLPGETRQYIDRREPEPRRSLQLGDLRSTTSGRNRPTSRA
jgi:hypothetical protein